MKKWVFKIIFLLFISHLCISQNKNLADSLLKLAKSMPDDTSKAVLLNKASESIRNSFPDSSLGLSQKALDISLKKNYKKEIATSYSAIAIVYRIKGQYDKCLKYNFQSLKIREEIGDTVGMSKNYNNIGLVYSNQKDFQKALEYLGKALELSKKVSDTLGVAKCLNNMGIVFSDKKQYEKALDCYFNALALINKTGDKHALYTCLSNIGFEYENLRQYDKALEYNMKALKLREESSDSLGIAISYANIASMNLILADSVANNAQEKRKYYLSSIDYCTKALGIATRQKSLHFVYQASLMLKEAHFKVGNKDQALRYANICISMGDSLFRENKAKAVAETEAKYQSERKQREIEFLNKDKELSQVKIKQQQLLINVIIAALVLVVIFAIVLARLFSQKRLSNKLLGNKNIELYEKSEEIRQQNEEIRAQAEQIEVANKELEKLSIAASETDNSIAITDKYGNLTWVNKGFKNMYGYTLDEIIAEKGFNIKDSSRNEDFSELFASCSKAPMSKVYLCEVFSRSGERKFIQTTLTSVFDDTGSLSSFVVVDTDVTKLKLAEEEIMVQKTQLLEKNAKLMDSISYAQLIQLAILPTEKQLRGMFSDVMLVFIPKDVVSGDFYFLYETVDYKFVALADCTGHGIPGALMSMIGSTLIHEIISDDKKVLPSRILELLNEKVIRVLKQDGSLTSQDDGMDVSICRIDKKNGEAFISLAGQIAYVVIDNGQLLQVTDESSFSIGGMAGVRSNVRFADFKFSFSYNLKMYLFSDGIFDQFNFSMSEKFGIERLGKVLNENFTKPMESQRSILVNEFHAWKDGTVLFDDVTLLGFEIVM